MSSGAADAKGLVRGFWNRAPCGSSDATAPAGTREYYDQIEARRYEREPFIHEYADFASTKGLEVLEIGVGLGTDHVQFARAGAELHGIDLTDRSVEMVERRLAHEGLHSELRVADAELLPFEDASFDVVYSWGVLHHTPDTPRAFAEAIRVLRPQGRLCAMVYARHAWVAYGLWARNGPLRGRPLRSIADVLHSHQESPGTKGYTKRELRTMIDGLEDVRIEKTATPYDARFVGGLAGLTGRQLGFFMVIRGVKQR
ncbi:MAG TPA: class I SAM-dependent methyltransferase [Solirubrobacteraceae bacterium]|jgi:ubiquinone/menaquinone biosynthesis C-methylase UbiE|nr:class I SAM-dependent methyltransferase [Solirubrobacteraceae bacterium]